MCLLKKLVIPQYINLLNSMTLIFLDYFNLQKGIDEVSKQKNLIGKLQ